MGLKLFGHDNILSKGLKKLGLASSGFGEFLNDATGLTASAKALADSNMKMQKDAQAFTKWQMGNAHQQEVQDLQSAGLNPVLSADGGGAGGTPSIGGTGAGIPSANPISMISELINTINNSARTNADIDKTNADINNQTNKTQAEVNKLLKEAGYTEKQIEYYNKYGVFPGATTTTKMGGTIGSKLFGISGDTTVTEPVGLKHGKVNPDTYNGNSAKKQKYKRVAPDMTHLLYQ